jgi:hypothetical protein
MKLFYTAVCDQEGDSGVISKVRAVPLVEKTYTRAAQ